MTRDINGENTHSTRTNPNEFGAAKRDYVYEIKRICPHGAHVIMKPRCEEYLGPFQCEKEQGHEGRCIFDSPRAMTRDTVREFKISKLIKDQAVWDACQWEIAGGNNRADWKAICWSREYAEMIVGGLNELETLRFRVSRLEGALRLAVCALIYYADGETRKSHRTEAQEVVRKGLAALEEKQ